MFIFCSIIFININNEIMKKYFFPSVIFIFLLAFAFQSCNETPTAPNSKTVISILSPSTNSIASDTTTIKIQILGNENIVRLELYINHYLYFINTTTKTYYEFKWDARNYQDGAQAIINAIAYDRDGNSFESKFSIVYIYRFMPVNLTAKFVSDSEIKLNWMDFSKIETGFEIYEAVNDSNFSLLARIDSNKTAYTVYTPVDTSNSYYFRVRAYNLNSFSNFTPIVKAQIDLLPPTNVRGRFVSDTELVLNWDDNNSFAEGYWININYQFYTQIDQNTTTFTIKKNFYSYNNPYVITITAFAQNFHSQISEPIYMNFILNAPDSLHVNTIQNDKISLTWNNNSIYSKKFIVERKTNSGWFSQIAETVENTTNFIDSDLNTSETYQYRIKALTTINQSDYSNIIEVGYTQNLKISETINVPFNLQFGSFSGDYKYFFKNVDNTVEMYDVRDFSYLRTFEAPTDTQTISYPDILSNFNGSFVIRHFDARVPSSGTRIALWDTENGNLIQYFYEDYSGTPFSFTNDNQKLISFISARRLFVYSLVTGAKLSEVGIPESSGIASLLSNPPSNQFIILKSGEIMLYNLDNQSLIIRHYSGTQKILAASKDGVLLASLNNNSSINVWNFNTKEQVLQATYSEPIGEAAISQDNKYLFASTQNVNSKILIYDLKNKKIANEITGEGKIVHLSTIDAPFDFISITNNSRKYWTLEKDWMEFK